MGGGKRGIYVRGREGICERRRGGMGIVGGGFLLLWLWFSRLKNKGVFVSLFSMT